MCWHCMTTSLRSVSLLSFSAGAIITLREREGWIKVRDDVGEGGAG